MFRGYAYPYGLCRPTGECSQGGEMFKGVSRGSTFRQRG